MLKDKLNVKALTVRGKRGWEPLPSWSRFLIGLGAAIRRNRSEVAVRVALALPTRAYAAALVGAGAVLGGKHEMSAADHLQWLKTLESGATVAVLEGDRVKIGIFDGITETRGELHVAYKVDRGGRHLYPVSKAHFLQPLEGASYSLPKRQRGYKIEDLGRFVGEFVDEGPAQFLQRSTLNCLIVTQKTTFKQEIEADHFAVHCESGAVVGSLGDLLRVRSFANKGGLGYQSDVTASTGETPYFDNPPPVVVYDGSRAFLNFRPYWPQSHAVVLLDRWDYAFPEAATQIQSEYLNREGEWDGVDDLFPPPSFEYLSFTARRK